jgi:hypothetical protein
MKHKDEGKTSGHIVMTDSQRACIQHVLRNCASALEGLSLLLEQSTSAPSTEDLHGCLKGVVNALSNMDNAFQRGTFCPVTEQDCSYIARWIGCSGEPITGRTLYSITRS